MTRILKRFLAVWVGVGFLLSTSFGWPTDFWLVVLAATALWGAAGAILGLLLLLDSPIRYKPSRSWAVIVAAMVLFIPNAWWLGGRAVGWAYFLQHRAAYDRVVAAEIAKPSGGRPTTRSDHIVDEGPPIRVAFPWPGGIFDNWCGVVYDPTGVVMNVNGTQLGTDEWRSSPITRLFGGDMTECRRLSATYFKCCFT